MARQTCLRFGCAVLLAGATAMMRGPVLQATPDGRDQAPAAGAAADAAKASPELIGAVQAWAICWQAR